MENIITITAAGRNKVWALLPFSRLKVEKSILGTIHKLRLQGEVARWTKNVHFFQRSYHKKMSTQGDRC